MTSRLGKVLRNSFVELEYEGEIFKLYGLKGKHIYLLTKDKDAEIGFDKIIKIVHASLEQGDPEITLDEVESLELKVLTDIVEKVMEVSGLDTKKEVEAE